MRYHTGSIIKASNMNISGSVLKDNFRSTSGWLPVDFKSTFSSQRRLNKSEAVNYCHHYFPNSTFPYRLDQLIELGFDSLFPPQFRSWGNLGPSPWFGVSYDPIRKMMTEDLTGLVYTNHFFIQNRVGPSKPSRWTVFLAKVDGRGWK